MRDGTISFLCYRTVTNKNEPTFVYQKRIKIISRFIDLKKMFVEVDGGRYDKAKARISSLKCF